MATNNSINLTAAGYAVYDGAGTFSGRTFQAGTGISLANASGTAGNTTISSTGGGLAWSTASAGGGLAVNTGTIAISPGGALSFALPAVSAVGDTIALVLDGATSWAMTQPNAATQIRFGSVQTTLGVGGSLASTAQGDTVYVVCETANARWAVVDTMGNLSYV
jgi:hypothetical protein